MNKHLRNYVRQQRERKGIRLGPLAETIGLKNRNKGARLILQFEREGACTVEEVRPGALELRIALDGAEPQQIQASLTGSFHAPNVCLAVMAARSEGISWEEIGEGLARLGASGYRARLVGGVGPCTVWTNDPNVLGGLWSRRPARRRFRKHVAPPCKSNAIEDLN
jgi:hypothetical protein